MDRFELDQAVNRQFGHAYWPWWYAVAYIQPKPERDEAVRGATETHLTSKGSGFEAVGAFGRIVTALCGEDDPDSEAFHACHSRAEDRLLLAVKSGSIATWGRLAHGESLVELKASDWVGGEVDCSATCDLVKEGWREADRLSQIFDVERDVRFYDIHLPRDQVLALAERSEQETRRRMQDAEDVEHSEAFEEIAAGSDDLERSFWSAFVTCAWVGSRCEAFTAKAQHFERNEQVDRGGLYSWGAWSVLGGAMRHRFKVSNSDARRLIQNAIAGGALPTGGGVDVETRRRRALTVEEWQEIGLGGASLVRGVDKIMWSSADVVAAFPALKAKAAEANEAQKTGRARPPVSHAALSRWFEQRVAAFESEIAPRWKQCWDAARCDFPDNHISKDTLLETRRLAAPHWKPGRRGG